MQDKDMAKERLLEKVMQQQNILTFGSQDNVDMNHKKETRNII
jgi:hypothetical protein